MGAQSVIPPISAFLADALCEEHQFEEAEQFAKLAKKTPRRWTSWPR